MKICVCGKGGSGKSTIVKLMADALIKRGKEVIVLDSDESNASLFWMLGFKRPPIPLMESLGGKRSVQQKMLAQFSKGDGEPEMSIWEGDRIPMHSVPHQYVAQKGNLRLITTGKILHALEGCACPMGVVTKEFIKKVELGENEIMLVDMEAGIEHFGRGVETSVDAVVCVVEPSLESITIARKIKELTQSVGASFKGAVVNKASSAEQEAVVAEKLNDAAIPVLGTIRFHDKIVAACLEGPSFEVPESEAQMEGVIEKLVL